MIQEHPENLSSSLYENMISFRHAILILLVYYKPLHADLYEGQKKQRNIYEILFSKIRFFVKMESNET